MEIWNVLAVLMPCSLFALSIFITIRHIKRAPGFISSEMAWLSVPILVNVLSTLWAAKILSVATPTLELPQVYLQTTERVGLVLFFVMLVALASRRILNALSKATKWAVGSLVKGVKLAFRFKKA